MTKTINNVAAVVIHDHDGRVTRHEPTLWVQWSLNNQMRDDRINFADFLGFLRDTGRGVVHFDLDDHEGAVVVEVEGATYRKTWTQFLRDHIDNETLSDYLLCLEWEKEDTHQKMMTHESR